MIKNKNSNQNGSIIIYSLLIMLSIIMISVVLIKLLGTKFQIAREATYSIVALYAADSGMEWCLFSNRVDQLLEEVPPQITGLETISGITISYHNYNGTGVNNCVFNSPLNFRTVGIYREISRSLGVF